MGIALLFDINPTPMHTNILNKAPNPEIKKKSGTTPFFQAKLRVNTPGDAHELEADRVADQVMRMKEDEEPVVQRMPITPISGVQRMCADCEEKQEGKVQRQETTSGSSGGQTAPSVVSQVLSSGGGRPMEAGTRQFMESRFGQDFGQVRIHTGGQAAESASAIQAKAYTSGKDIVFGAGEYRPESGEGKRLLAHELAHVGQQGSPALVRRQSLGSTSPKIEKRFGLGMGNRFGLYDAELNRERKILTLIMRVNFNFIGAWPSVADQQAWIRDFITQVGNRWSFRFYLVPKGLCLKAHDTFYARINVIPTANNPHYTANISHTTTNIRSSVNSSNRTAKLDSLDTQERPRSRQGQNYKQRASEHEFGHMLGVPHIECDVSSRRCPSGDQYGDTIAERADIMGSGWLVSQRDYTPFTTAMYYFTGCNWKASHDMVYPIGDYPSSRGDKKQA